MYRFALSPKWILMHVVVLCMVSLFAVAGFWQLHRLDQRRTDNALVMKRRTMTALSDLETRDIVHRRVMLEGRYDTEHQTRLSGRGSNGRPGDHILTPLRIGGTSVVVDRGWVPFETPLDRATPSAELVEVVGLLLPSEGSGPFVGDAKAAGTLSRIDLARIAGALPYEIDERVYVLLSGQRPPQVGIPEPVQPAELSEGSHLAYAVQWFLFIAIALTVYVLLVRREAAKPPQLEGGKSR